jgi:hypothetical protein
MQGYKTHENTKTPPQLEDNIQSYETHVNTKTLSGKVGSKTTRQHLVTLCSLSQPQVCMRGYPAYWVPTITNGHRQKPNNELRKQL